MVTESSSAITVSSASLLNTTHCRHIDIDHVFSSIFPRYFLLIKYGITIYLPYVMLQVGSYAIQPVPFPCKKFLVLSWSICSVFFVTHYLYQKSLFHYRTILNKLHFLLFRICAVPWWLDQHQQWWQHGSRQVQKGKNYGWVLIFFFLSRLVPKYQLLNRWLELPPCMCLLTGLPFSRILVFLFLVCSIWDICILYVPPLDWH